MGKFVLIGLMLLLSVVLSKSMDTASPLPQALQEETTTLDTEESVTSILPAVGKLELDDSNKVELSSVGPSSVKQIDATSMEKIEPSLESATSILTSGAIMTSKAIDELLTSPNTRSPLDILDSLRSDQENSTVMDTSTILASTRINEPSTGSATSTLLSKNKKDEPAKPTVDFNATTLSTTQAETHGRMNYTDDNDGKLTSKPDDLTTPRFIAPPGKSDAGNTPNDKTDGDPKRKGKIALISVIIVILILLLVTMIFLMIRKKKRSGSFRTQSRKGARDDVWAGQVPELGDGKPMQDSTMIENGTAGTKSEPPQEQEMVTFVSGEKTMDSVEEANELEAGGKAEANGGGRLDKEAETTPLLAEDSQSPQQPDTEEEQLPPPLPM